MVIYITEILSSFNLWTRSKIGRYCRICAARRSIFHDRASLRAVRSSVSSVQWMRHFHVKSLTIIPRVWMGSESIAHEAKDWMDYWLGGHEGERNNNCFSKIHLVGQKYQDKTTLASKTRFSRHCFGFQSRRFSLLVGYNIWPSSGSINQNTANNW